MAWEPVYRSGVLIGYARAGARVVRSEKGWSFDGRWFGSPTEAMEAADYARGER